MGVRLPKRVLMNELTRYAGLLRRQSDGAGLLQKLVHLRRQVNGSRGWIRCTVHR